MLMTSATRGEGKTTTLVNTAIVFSQLGIRVLVIDGDLRRPRCHALLKMENTVGFADLLAGQIDVETAIRPTQRRESFSISAGTIPPNPAELLGSRRMHELLQELHEQFEFIFIDSSPVMAVSDAVFLSTMVEGTLLVVNRRTPKPLVRKTRQRLSTPHTKILGVLLNRVDIRAGEYGSYYKHYYDYYPHDVDFRADGRGAASNGNGALAHGGNGHGPAAVEPDEGDELGEKPFSPANGAPAAAQTQRPRDLREDKIIELGEALEVEAPESLAAANELARVEPKLAAKKSTETTAHGANQAGSLTVAASAIAEKTNGSRLAPPFAPPRQSAEPARAATNRQAIAGGLFSRGKRQAPARHGAHGPHCAP